MSETAHTDHSVQLANEDLAYEQEQIVVAMHWLGKVARDKSYILEHDQRVEVSDVESENGATATVVRHRFVDGYRQRKDNYYGLSGAEKGDVPFFTWLEDNLVDEERCLENDDFPQIMVLRDENKANVLKTIEGGTMKQAAELKRVLQEAASQEAREK